MPTNRPVVVSDQTLPGISAFVAILRRRMGIILIGLMLGVGAAALYCVVATPRYESMTRILVIKKLPALPAHGTESEPTMENSVDDDLLATHVLILQSPRLIRTALEQLDSDALATIERARDNDQDAIEYVADNLQVFRGGEGQGRAAHVITLQFRHTSAEDCQLILTALVESYQSFLSTTLQRPVDEALALIQQARDDIASELHGSRARYRDFREQAPLFWNGVDRLNIHQARLEKYESALAEVQLRLDIEQEARRKYMRQK